MWSLSAEVPLYGLNNWHDESQISNEMVLGGGAFGRWLSHEVGALLNEITALIKETSWLCMQVKSNN